MYGSRIAALAGSFALLSVSCLPDDTRAPPGELVLTVSAEEASVPGAVTSTEDGWVLTFTRLLVVLGGASLDGDDCDAYYQGEYGRIFAFTHESPQRVSTSYGLGPCQFGFRIATPAWDSLLGAGVSEDERTLLRTPGSDSHASNQGISVQIEGSASRLEVTKTFRWSFRRFIEYNDCSVPSDTPDATPREGVLLSAKEVTNVDIVIRGTALFRNARMEPPAPPRFEAFRAADDEHGDADGVVTLEELDNSPLPPEAAGGALIQTLGDRVYLQLLPEIAQFQGVGRCQVRSSPDRPDFGGPR
jgi:hypothetical protein